MYFKKLIHPELFQGHRKKDKYFEGWYYKLVSFDEHTTLAFIPGISKNKKDPHAFIQVFISTSNAQDAHLSRYYFKFPSIDFSYTYDTFSVSIGKNFFSKEKIAIDLKNDQISLYGVIEIQQITTIKKSILAPNIMGPFGYLNFMECYHGIVSMHHTLLGELNINQDKINFTEGKGYIEKDWGKSFPRAYVWLQSNHFKNEQTSLMFSYADIPFLGFYFKGLIANLYLNGKEYRFATYNFTKVLKEDIKGLSVHYQLKRGKYILDIKATSKTQIDLASPRNGEMIEQIKEGLSGQIEIMLYRNKQLIYEDTGDHAGIEIMKK